MSQLRDCAYCGYSFHFSQHICPHCARPANYPNVYAARQPAEADALRERYRSAREAAQSRGAAAAAVEAFETELANSRAVIARPPGEVQRLSTSDNEGYASFYELVAAGARFPSGNKWDARRSTADEALFPYYKEQIRFAALTLDGAGLQGYGDNFLVLRTEMIAHRASVFEENSLRFFSEHYNSDIDSPPLPPGYRATWAERAMLCVAKLGDRIDAATPPGAYSGILLRRGTRPEDDDFVEVHIWGPMTIRTMERVIDGKTSRHASRKITNRANKQRLAKVQGDVG